VGQIKEVEDPVELTVLFVIMRVLSDCSIGHPFYAMSVRGVLLKESCPRKGRFSCIRWMRWSIQWS